MAEAKGRPRAEPRDEGRPFACRAWRRRRSVLFPAAKSAAPSRSSRTQIRGEATAVSRRPEGGGLSAEVRAAASENGVTPAQSVKRVFARVGRGVRSRRGRARSASRQSGRAFGDLGEDLSVEDGGRTGRIQRGRLGVDGDSDMVGGGWGAPRHPLRLQPATGRRRMTKKEGRGNGPTKYSATRAGLNYLNENSPPWAGTRDSSASLHLVQK